MENRNNEEYNYTYAAPSAGERKQIEDIRRQYAPLNAREEKFNKLRELDGKVRGMPTCIALSFGVVGCLIFGLGLACVLEWNIWFVGIALGVLGAGIAMAAYPLYHYTTEKYKKKYGAEILRLSDELLKEMKN